MVLIHEFTFNSSDRALENFKSIIGGDNICYRTPFSKVSCTHAIRGQFWATTNAEKSAMLLTPDLEAVIDRVTIFPMPSEFVVTEVYKKLKRKKGVYLRRTALVEEVHDLGEGLLNIIVARYVMAHKKSGQTDGAVLRFLEKTPAASRAMSRAKTETVKACDIVYKFLERTLSYEEGVNTSLHDLWNMCQEYVNKESVSTGLTSNVNRRARGRLNMTFEWFKRHVKFILFESCWLAKKISEKCEIINNTNNLKRKRNGQNIQCVITNCVIDSISDQSIV